MIYSDLGGIELRQMRQGLIQIFTIPRYHKTQQAKPVFGGVEFGPGRDFL